MAKASPALLSVLLPLLLLLLCSGAKAEEKSLCEMNEKGFMACLPSVTGGAPAQPPSGKCCAALAKADLLCLCKYKDSPVLPQIGIKPDLAKQLPAKCKLNAPTECN
ncbi:putative lipid-transfer protein DIR1 [Curcuma longa]|uniref:putative lipid-transfer protein DIR1 n=1 Tax=Curcuma longa TaxID=136217 RepID=UPI003D9EDBAE